MIPTLYRMELTPQQQQQAPQQQGGTLPMQRPSMEQPQQAPQGPTGFSNAYQQEKPADDIQERFTNSLNQKTDYFGNNRLTTLMQERIGGFASNLRGQIEQGNMTNDEAKQVLNRAVQEEFGSVKGWMDGKPEPTSWRETKNPEMTRKYILENSQAFEELEAMRVDIEATKAKLEAVHDKKNPKFQKAIALLGAKTQKFQQMETTLKQGMYGGEAIEAGLTMKKARGEDTL